MTEMLRALAQHLRDRRHRLSRRVTVKSADYDPTFGPCECNEDIEVIDFCALLDEIDEFAATFQET